MKQTISCPDCGAVPAIHFVEWSVAFLDTFFSVVSRPIGFIWRKIGGLFIRLPYETLLLSFFKLLIWLRLAKVVQEPDSKVTMRTRVLWDEARARGITMYEIRLFGLARDFCVAEYQGQIRSFEGLPRPKGMDSESLAWMDNKSVMMKKFEIAGIPVPRGEGCFTEREALRVFHRLGPPVIVKPHVGSRSRHTFIHISDDKELLRAFRSAKQLSFLAIIQEELRGFVFRVTLINKKVAAVMRREPPHVVGDDIHTVRQLVQIENQNPLREGPMFHHLNEGNEAEEELQRQGIDWETIPKQGQWVVLNQKVGRGNGASNADVTEEVHPENILLFEKIAQMLDDSLIGIDFIMQDVSRPWTEQLPCGVIECNSLPFIDLHYFPYTGPVQPVAKNIWDMIFPESKK